MARRGGEGVPDSAADQNVPRTRTGNAGDIEDSPHSRDSGMRERGGRGTPRRPCPTPTPPGDLAQFDEPPHEGDFQVRRPPGVRAGRYPDIDIIVTATLDQLAQARH